LLRSRSFASLGLHSYLRSRGFASLGLHSYLRNRSFASLGLHSYLRNRSFASLGLLCGWGLLHARSHSDVPSSSKITLRRDSTHVKHLWQ